jgi:hypothetical protein
MNSALIADDLLLSQTRNTFSRPELNCGFVVAIANYDLCSRQRSEQYLTSSQTAFHFLRHVKGLPQVAQIFCGRSDFLGFFGGAGMNCQTGLVIDAR